MHSFLFRRGFILPIVVVGIIPITIASLLHEWNQATPVSFSIGIIPFGLGLYLLVITARLFDTHGGSLAPWNPPIQMVELGPYQYSRNPMITGIFAMLLGEAVLLKSWPLAVWFIIFVIAQNVYIRFDEEPALRKRFGESYIRYCEQVPRWIPSWPLRKPTTRTATRE